MWSFVKKGQMKNAIIIFFLFITTTAYGQELSTRDSISIFYDSLIDQLKSNYIYKERTNWESINPIKQNAMESSSFEESLSYCTALFDTINGSHLNIFSDYGWYKWSKGRQYKQEDFNLNFLTEYEAQPGFEVKVLKDQYGYILLPGMLMIDLPQDSIDMESQRMYDKIMEVVSTTTLKGWIIDLRFNIGGNVFPMLAALYHFLGNNSVYMSLDKDGVVQELTKLENGAVYDDRKNMATIIPKQQADIKTPVALITGILTASSGELVAVSFNGRQNVQIIGEPTAGMLTGNTLTQLPFDVKLTLTSGYLADRKANYEPKIIPHIPVIKEANFQDISLDTNIIEAIKFIESVVVDK